MQKSPKAPTPPPVATTVPADQAAKSLAFKDTMAGATIGQDTAIGSLDYKTEIDPITGQLKYKAKTAYNPNEQQILENQEAQKLGLGETGQNMIENSSDMYSAPPDFVKQAMGIIDPLTGPMNAAWEKFMSPERENRRTQLANQGITEGNPTFDREMAKVSNQQNLTKGQWLAQMEPAAFQQAQSQYEEPMNIIQKIMGMTSPADLKSQFVNTPQATEGATDVLGAYKTNFDEQFQNYQQEVARQNAMMSMFTGLAGT